MRDIVINADDQIITLTGSEIEAIIAGNLDEDVIGIEDDLRDLFRSKYSGTINANFEVIHLGDSPGIICTLS